MTKVLLTGGSGFIGKNIQESFLSDKYEIIAPRSFELNLFDTESVDEYFKDKSFDVIIHCAAKPGHRNAKDTSFLLFSNLRMFENLVRHKDKYKKFINIGSGAVYGCDRDVSNVCEEEIFKQVPKDEHGFCKYVIQKRISMLEDFVDLNLFGVYGKYEDWEIRFISNAICKTLFDMPVTLRQNRRFSYLYIDDLMPVLDYVIQNKMKYKSYNVVHDDSTELLTAAGIVKEVSGKPVDIIVANEGYGLDYTGSVKRLRAEIFDLKFTSLRDSIKILYEYYESQKALIDCELLKKDK